MTFRLTAERSNQLSYESKVPKSVGAKDETKLDYMGIYAIWELNPGLLHVRQMS